VERLSMIFGAVIICTSVQGFKERERERDIDVVTSNDMSGPGEVAPLAHSVPGSSLQALAATSSRDCLLHRCRSEKQREIDLGRSAQPDAIAPRRLQPKLWPRAPAGIG